MKYEYNTLEEKIKSLPDDMQVAMFSPEISEQLEAIAEKYSLDIEQTGILMDITSYVMLALIPSKNFVSELAKEANIDTGEATNIAKDINDEVFIGIKESLRKIQEVAEKNAEINSPVTENKIPRPVPTSVNQAEVLHGLENPDEHSNLPINILIPVPTVQTGKPPMASSVVTPAAPAAPVSPLVSRLMTTPTATANEKVEVKIPPRAPTPAAPSSRPSTDPYREPIE